VKVTFINPSLTGRRSRGAMEPLTFASLAALTPPDIERVLYDECVEPIPFDEPTDLAAISATTFTARRAYQIALAFRRRGVPVVLGGYHPSFRPDEAARFADAVVVGEAENVWAGLLRDARAGTLAKRYASPCESLAGLRFDRSIFAGKRYQPVRLVQFGRGCRFSCDFCSIPRFFHDRRMQRPVREVAAEVETLGPGHVFFVDDNLYVGDTATRELLDALVPLRRNWMCQASIDLAEDLDLVRRLKRAGCFAVLMGFESVKPATLARMGKTWHRGTEQYAALVRRLHDHGILVYGTFVFGYDEDTPQVIEATLEFAERSKLFLAAFNLLTPIPGTATYDRLAAEGRLIGDPWYLDPRSRFTRAVLEPKGMSREAFERSVHAIRMRFYSLPSIVRRAVGTPRLVLHPMRLGLHLTANAIYRSEVHRLVDAPFGDPDDLAPLPLDGVDRGRDGPCRDPGDVTEETAAEAVGP